MTNLPAYLVDIDGTVAIKGDRDIFDWSRVILDTPNDDVVRIVRMIMQTGWEVIFMTGRMDDCRQATTDWLRIYLDAVVDEETLLMRKSGDYRKDAIVKRELYDAHIAGRYDVFGVFDDRNQVVKMWRELGLTVFQVAPGDFDEKKVDPPTPN